MKVCFKCNEYKPLSEFYKHPKMADGTINKCKECTKLDVRKNREANIEYYREYDRERGNRQDYSYTKQYRNHNPVKYKATTKLNNAIKSGKITRQSYCQGCGDKCVTDGHHEDYSKPFDVTWLCRSCHIWLHKMRESNNV